VARRVVALAGGVGAARFLSGLVQAVPPEELTVIVNTGDDRDFFGLRVCPDLDIITYTLAGRINRETGWGLAGETWHALEELRKFGGDTWFGLGDRDLATHIWRTRQLAAGATLVEVTREISRAFGVAVELLPMSEDPAASVILREGGTRTDFEEYLVRDGAPDDVAGVDLSAAQAAQPAPGVLEALDGAETLLLCPSNPVVSIGPIRAMPALEACLRRRRDAVGISPIISGKPVKGPADRLLRALGSEVSALGVARLYTPIARGLLIDREDRALVAPIEALGLEVRVEETLMRTPKIARALAESALALARGGA
jgi:LPPG:FO 2-phospho-L-lactate transferase